MRLSATYEECESVLRYEPDTGLFFWKIKVAASVEAGDRTGVKRSDGYISITIKNKSYLAHRAAWLLIHRSWPVEHIDHINGDRGDNRIANLREASRSENNRNGAFRKNNTTGHRGVSWDKQTRKWMAQIVKDRKNIKLGRFDTIEAAAEAYRKAADELHGEFVRRSLA